MYISRAASVLVISASALVVSASVGACTDDDTAATAGQDSGTSDASATDSATADTGTADTATGQDAATDTSSSDAPLDVDAAATAPIPAGTWVWNVWTCSDGVRTTDIKAFAVSLGIMSVEEVIATTTGTVNVIYSGSPACTRSTDFTLAYPSSGKVTSTTAAAYSCSATCAGSKCTAGSQAVLVDTYSYSVAGNTLSETRVLDAAFISQVTLQKAAGCQVGDTEIGTFTK
ncbi:MAG: hypothetical protein JWM74_3354 [Myxococcaceae bacterium]|nr:hypothetical protein [Myxococcaceae bacterium]